MYYSSFFAVKYRALLPPPQDWTACQPWQCSQHFHILMPFGAFFLSWLTRPLEKGPWKGSWDHFLSVNPGARIEWVGRWVAQQRLISVCTSDHNVPTEGHMAPDLIRTPDNGPLLGRKCLMREGAPSSLRKGTDGQLEPHFQLPKGTGREWAQRWEGLATWPHFDGEASGAGRAVNAGLGVVSLTFPPACHHRRHPCREASGPLCFFPPLCASLDGR